LYIMLLYCFYCSYKPWLCV